MQAERCFAAVGKYLRRLPVLCDLLGRCWMAGAMQHTAISVVYEATRSYTTRILCLICGPHDQDADFAAGKLLAHLYRALQCSIP